MRITRLPGFTILTVFALILTGVTAVNIFTIQPIILPLFIVLSIFVLVAMIQVYFRDVHRQTKTSIALSVWRTDGIAVIFGAVITYALHGHTVLDVVLATGLVGIGAALIMRRVQVPIYCGAFVGMSSPMLLGWGPFLLASLLASILFVIAKDLYNGYGGKLGTIAFTGAFIAGFIYRSPFLEGGRFSVRESVWILVISVVAAVLTYVMSIRLRQGPVLGSAFMGFYLGAVLMFFPAVPAVLPVVAIGATFVGMSNMARLPHEGYVALGGVLFALLFIFSAPYFNGAGGKLGTIAFISSLSIAACHTTINHFMNAPKKHA